jgi:hypothetical protein
VSAAVAGPFASQATAVGTCITDQALTKKVCVDWIGEEYDPQYPEDFGIVWSGEPGPDVTLYTGKTNWLLWTEEYNREAVPVDLGDIRTTDSENYVVTIAMPSGSPGAIDVGSIILQPPSHYSSLGSASKISGDLLGDLIVQPDGSNNGGDINLEIGGAVAGNSEITAYKITALDIGDEMVGNINATTITALDIGSGLDGDIGNITEPTVELHIIIGGDVADSANINVYEIQEDAVLEVKGDVKRAVITVGNMTGTSGHETFIELNTDGGPENTFSGRLVLTNGISIDARVTIHGLTTPWVGGNCEVDLTNDAVAGILELSQGGVADIVNGGAVTGAVTLAKGTSNSYTGQATFASLWGG